ncbi:fatty acid desaturase [Nocardia puris]|uniref:fatty acid desaturase family protein n=1 Tax=Nocardia puris TaxID=208602 RepID=UPI0018946379|nr:fatty acid desaturase [Nocardia puris]MBF6212202.1 fatty acid desaturase [Nocardia puris]
MAKRTSRRVCAFRSARRLALSLALVFGPALLVAWRPDWFSWWLMPLLWAAQILGISGISSAAHEAVHNHLFYDARLERLFGRITHGLMLLNHDVHRRYHLVHHANTGTDEDSEGVFDFNELDSVRAYVRYLIRWAVPPSPLHVLNWRAGVAVISKRPTALDPIGRRQASAGFVVPALMVAMLVTWLVADPVAALMASLLPLCCLAPVFGYLTAVPEHFGLAGHDVGDRTRNIRTWRPVQYLVWNFNVHAAHHRQPHLHFSLLSGAAARSSAPSADGYRRFHTDLLRNVVRAQRGLPPAVVLPEHLGIRPRDSGAARGTEEGTVA